MSPQEVKEIVELEFKSLSPAEQDWLQKYLVYPYEIEMPISPEDIALAKVIKIAEGVDAQTGQVSLVYDPNEKAFGVPIENIYAGPIGSLSDVMPDSLTEQTSDEESGVIQEKAKRVYNLERPWPLVVLSCLAIFCILLIAVIWTVGVFVMPEEDRPAGFTPSLGFILIALFGYPFWISASFLLFRKKAKKFLNIASFLAAIIIAMIIYYIVSRFTGFTDTLLVAYWIVVLGAFVLIKRRLRAYCFTPWG